MNMKNDTKKFLFVGGIVPIAIILTAVFRIVFNSKNEDSNAPVNFWAGCFLSDGRTLATVGGLNNPNDTPRRGELVIWDLATSSEKIVFKEKSTVRSIACSLDGQILAIGTFSGATKLINPDAGKIIATLVTQDSVNAVAFSPDNKQVATATLNDKITLWNIVTKENNALSLPGETVINVAFSTAGRELVATTRKGKAYLFDLLQPDDPQELDAYVGPPNTEPNAEAIAFAPDGKSFVTGCQKCLRLWDCPSGKLIRELSGSTASVNSAAFSPDGNILATIDSEGMLVLWDPAHGKLLQTKDTQCGNSFCVAFSPDGNQIATIGREGNIAKIWDVNTLAQLTLLQRTNASNHIN